MRTPIKWIQQYIDINVDHDALFHRLTMAGMEVEAVEEVAGDTVFEIEVTPNRPDCLSILGIGREVSAVLDESLKIPEVKEYPSENKFDVSIDIQASDDCGRYIGTIIRDVNVGQTPSDMAGYLLSLGMSGVNNIVDITNFSLLENGQPLHAFDLDKLAGGKIIVRRAKKGETIEALDDNTYELDEDVLVIADAEKPVAIAGIMGGKAAGVTAQTKNIVLESAHFDQKLIRRTSRKIGLSSDSCYRFERGVDWDGIAFGANRATELILRHAGGAVVAKNDVIANNHRPEPGVIKINQYKIESVLGTTVEMACAEKILTRLGCAVLVNGDELAVTPPCQRGDLAMAEDIIEEIARVIGYDNLPSSLPLIKAVNISMDHHRADIKRVLNEAMRGYGFNEIIPFSMTNQEVLDKCRLGDVARVAIKNPMSLEQEALRPRMLPSFMGVYQTNFNRGQKDLRLFEIGKVYPLQGEEKWQLGFLMTGKQTADWRLNKQRDVDFYDAKGVVEALFDELHIDQVSFEPDTCPPFEQGRFACIKTGDTTLGFVGEVAKDVLRAWKIKKTNAFFAVLFIDALDTRRQVSRKARLLSEYPAVTHDISLAVHKDVAYQQVVAICKAKGKPLLTAIDFREEYTGEKINDDQRGFVFSLKYQSDERTLTEDEVTAVHEAIRQALADELKAVYR